MRMLRARPSCSRSFRRYYSSTHNLIQIQSGTFYREHPSSASPATNPPYFPNLTFKLPATDHRDLGKPVRKTDHWAIIGASDTTAFLDVLRGSILCIPPNARTFPYLASSEIENKDSRLRIPNNAVRYVGFNTGNKAGLGGVGGTQGAYLSARYESRREETDWSVLQYLKGETELNPSEQLTQIVTNATLLDRVIRDLRLGNLLDMPVSNLSNGQSRRCRIAKALLSEPLCLLLDEPFMGLDPPTLVNLSPILRDLAYRSDPLLVLGLRPQDPIPDWITNLVVLGKDRGVGLMGDKTEVLEILGSWNKAWIQKDLGASDTEDLKSEHHGLQVKFGKPFEGMGDILSDQGIAPFPSFAEDPSDPSDLKPERTKQSHAAAKSSAEPLIELDSIRLSYGTKVVLGHKTPLHPDGGLSLSIDQGTRLALIGPNGSGKTTLLSLLTSDHPQSYSLPIRFFGRTRLPELGKPGLSLWEIQRRIGHSAPEVHGFYPKSHSIRQVLESAWAETYSTKPELDEARSTLVSRFLTFWTPELQPHRRANDPEDLSWADEKETNYFRILPFGSQRLLLLLRAIIKEPDIIILDEAFSGLDSATRDKAMAFLERGEDALSSSDPSRQAVEKMTGMPFKGLSDKQALVVVSHVREEIPPCVDEFLRLPSEEEATDQGKDVSRGQVNALAGGKGLRSKEGWAEVWGL